MVKGDKHVTVPYCLFNDPTANETAQFESKQAPLASELKRHQDRTITSPFLTSIAPRRRTHISSNTMSNPPPEEHLYHPQDAVRQAGIAAAITGGAGLAAAAIRSATSPQNIGPFGAFSRFGSTIAVWGMLDSGGWKRLQLAPSV